MSAEGLESKLAAASSAASTQLKIDEVPQARLADALANAVDPQRLVDNLAEAWRTSPEKAKSILAESGFGGMLARMRVETGGDTSVESFDPLSKHAHYDLADGKIRVLAINPALSEPVAVSPAVFEAVKTPFESFRPGAADDALGVLYRREPLAYAKKWMSEIAPKIRDWIKQNFGESGPKYVVNSGIGANEMFNYFVASLANTRSGEFPKWFLINSPREMLSLPGDANVGNTLFMEFSRSGITEETVKLHELTPADAHRIVFSNSGTLRDLGIRDGNMVLELPSEVSGRYGRNTTPILMAPMMVCGLDIESYWSEIQKAVDDFDLTKEDSLPSVMARFIRLQQLQRSVNHIYLGTNDERLRYSADEFCQFWNEGVNRGENDITMSRYLGLPRDSHMNLEAILGTSDRKIAIFLLRTGQFESHDLLLDKANALDGNHRGLSPADVDLVLALANVKRCSEKMPTLVVAVREPELEVSAWLGQLWADTTLVYSRLIGVDPGSNPEVKAVRTRAARWLANTDEARSLIGRF